MSQQTGFCVCFFKENDGAILIQPDEAMPFMERKYCKQKPCLKYTGTITHFHTRVLFHMLILDTAQFPSFVSATVSRPHSTALSPCQRSRNAAVVWWSNTATSARTVVGNIDNLLKTTPFNQTTELINWGRQNHAWMPKKMSLIIVTVTHEQSLIIISCPWTDSISMHFSSPSLITIVALVKQLLVMIMLKYYMPHRVSPFLCNIQFSISQGIKSVYNVVLHCTPNKKVII